MAQIIRDGQVIGRRFEGRAPLVDAGAIERDRDGRPALHVLRSSKSSAGATIERAPNDLPSETFARCIEAYERICLSFLRTMNYYRLRMTIMEGKRANSRN